MIPSNSGTQPIITFSLPVHSDITAEANQGFLSDQQLALVISFNISQDLRQTESKIHFDNCNFPGASEYIQQQWQLIEAHHGVSYTTFAAFGFLLHTVQDFYAHSNWIEIHQQEDPIPVWDLNLATLPPDIVSGTWRFGFPKKCPRGAPTHDQLNKDKATSEEGRKIVTSGPNTGKTYFQLAFDCAIRASEVQFSRLKRVGLKVPSDPAKERPLSSLKKLAAVASEVESMKDSF